MRPFILPFLCCWAGATLLLSRLRWFSRPPLVERLRPYSRGGMAVPARTGLLSVESFREVVEPLARLVGERMARLVGINEDLAVRLERIHAPLDVTTFRVRQLGWSALAVGATGLAVAALRPAPLAAFFLLAGAPVLAFLVLEQQLARKSASWRRRVFLELPVISEQLAMLLGAGFSLGAALNRLASRGHGAVAADLRRVVGRMRQGLTEADALREWAAVAQVRPLDRLVAVLGLNQEAGDIGRLISEEAKGIRKDAQRELVETMERRGQQVWIPVTVATLIPGVIFLSIPFVAALRQFSGS